MYWTSNFGLSCASFLLLKNPGYINNGYSPKAVAFHARTLVFPSFLGSWPLGIISNLKLQTNTFVYTSNNKAPFPTAERGSWWVDMNILFQKSVLHFTAHKTQMLAAQRLPNRIHAGVEQVLAHNSAAESQQPRPEVTFAFPLVTWFYQLVFQFAVGGNQ